MLRKSVCLSLFLVLLSCALPVCAQQAASADSVVPSLVKFTGSLTDADGKPLTGTVGVNFYLYKEKEGGAPLWMETQNVQADKNGHYSVMLGSASAHGLPSEVFVAGEARWLGVQVSGQAEQPRSLLLSVPYALKALDAETLGGKPASAFMAASGLGAEAAVKAGPGQAGPQAEQSNEIVCSSTTACKTGFVPLFSTNGGSAKVTDSIVTQSGSNIAVAGTETVSSSASAPAILATSTGTAGTSNGVQGVTGSASASGVAGINSSGIGVYGFSSGSAATSAGVWGQTSSATGAGVEGVNTSTAASATGIYGYSNSYGVIGSSPHVGVYGASSGSNAVSDGVDGVTGSATGSGVAGINNGGGVGVYGTGGVGVVGTGSSFGFQTDSNVQQARSMGGWVKAMALFNQFQNTITECYNSTLAGAAATTPPCGFTSNANGITGFSFIDFGFEVDDRFFSVVPMQYVCNSGRACGPPLVYACTGITLSACTAQGATPNRLGIVAMDNTYAVQQTIVSVLVY